jgi:hypothetical protein
MSQRIIPIICLSILTACAGNSVKDSESIQQSAIQQAKSVNLDPQTVITESQNLQIEAQREDLYFFSPTYMKQAEDALEDAEDAIKSKKLPHEIIAHALTAQKLFKRGLENKPTVLKQLKATFDGIEMLREIETNKVLTSDFQDIQDDTKDLIILIEQGKTTEAINEQKDLLSDIAELEVKTLKKTYLSVVEHALDKAEDADAEDFAAKSFDKAQKTFDTFEKFIETSAEQRVLIKEKSKMAVHLAQHAENVAKAAQPLLKLNTETAEDHILFIESLMNRIATALNQGDILNLNLNSQSIAIAQTAETINKRANTQAQLASKPATWDAEKAELLKTIDELKKPQTLSPIDSVSMNKLETNEKAPLPNNTTEAEADTTLNPKPDTGLTAAPEDAKALTTNLATSTEPLAEKSTKETLSATEKADTPVVSDIVADTPNVQESETPSNSEINESTPDEVVAETPSSEAAPIN